VPQGERGVLSGEKTGEEKKSHVGVGLANLD